MRRMEAMEKKLLCQKELLTTMAEEKEDVERENEDLYEQLKVATSRKKGKRRGMALGVQADKIIVRLMLRIFCMLKFSLQEWLFRWTDLDDGSYCARIRAEFEKAKRPFNKLVFRAVCEMTVEWQVKARAKHVTCVRAACLGEYTAAEM